MKRLSLIFALLTTLLSETLQAQSISLDSCQAWAYKNYPLTRQMELLDKSKDYQLENASKGSLPRLNVVGQATYQSAVTKVPVDIPNLNIPTVNKQQYRLYLEFMQPITDLRTVKYQKELVEQNADIRAQSLEVELYSLRERINQLYFGVLLMDAQLEQVELMKKDLQTGIDKIKTAIENGVAIQSSAQILEVEMLKADQKMLEITTNRKAFADMLSLFIQRPITDTTVFEKPPDPSISSDINRQELQLFDMQQKTFDTQKKLLTMKTMPKFSFYLQSGLGRPALNMLNSDLQTYYIGGVRLNWSISSLYTSNKEKELVNVNSKILETRKETFLFNTQLQLKQQNEELIKIRNLITTDQKIVSMRKNITNTTKTQLEYGTATSSEYLTQVNAEDQARQTLILHQIQLLQAQFNYQNTTGNQ